MNRVQPGQRCAAALALVAAAAIPACVIRIDVGDDDPDPWYPDARRPGADARWPVDAWWPDAPHAPVDAGCGPDGQTPPDARTLPDARIPPDAPGPRPDAGPDAGPAPGTYDFAYIGFHPGASSTVLMLGNLEGASTPLRAPYWTMSNLSISPTGSHVAFSGMALAPDFWRLHVVSLADGSDIVVSLGEAMGRPSWSPDGTQLVYAAYVDDAVALVRASIDGSAEVLAIEPSFDGACLAPAWSPDGAEIAYANGDTIQVRTVATGETRTIASSVSGACKPQWAPDSQKIAFTHAAGAGSWLAIVGTRGGAVRHLARLVSQPRIANPRWSPQGRSIAFVDFDLALHDTVLELVGFSGAAPETLVHLNMGVGEGSGQPAWSPDGSAILFVRFSGDVELAAVDIASRQVRGLGLAGHTIDNTFPGWFPQPIAVP